MQNKFCTPGSEKGIQGIQRMRQQRFSNIVSVFFCLLAVGVAAFQMYYFSVFTVDDAYISFRYVENFAKGDGLVFNRGEYVEGHTNFLWVILLGLLKKPV